jgi:hypothetical protein
MVGYGRSRVEAPTHEIYGLFPSPVQAVKCCLDNLRPGGAIGWSVEPSEGKGRVGRVLWLFWGFVYCSPRLCRLSTEWLVPVSKYWTYRSHVGDMGPVSLVAGRPQVLGLSLLLQWLSWERNWGRSRGPLSQAERWSREHFFLGAVVSIQPCRWLVKDCHVRGPPAGSACRAYVDWRGKHMCRVGRVFPTGCTSIRITATLGYE